MAVPASPASPTVSAALCMQRPDAYRKAVSARPRVRVRRSCALSIKRRAGVAWLRDVPATPEIDTPTRKHEALKRQATGSSVAPTELQRMDGARAWELTHLLGPRRAWASTRAECCCRPPTHLFCEQSSSPPADEPSMLHQARGCPPASEPAPRLAARFRRCGRGRC